jgi:hypothetical protein
MTFDDKSIARDLGIRVRELLAAHDPAQTAPRNFSGPGSTTISRLFRTHQRPLAVLSGKSVRSFLPSAFREAVDPEPRSNQYRTRCGADIGAARPSGANRRVSVLWRISRGQPGTRPMVIIVRCSPSARGSHEWRVPRPASTSPSPTPGARRSSPVGPNT